MQAVLVAVFASACWFLATATVDLRAEREARERTAKDETDRLHMLDDARKRQVNLEAELMSKQLANLEAARQLNEQLKKGE